MKPVAIHPEARAEAMAAGDYYEECCPGLGRAFTDSLVDALDRIVARPQSFALHKASGARKCVMSRFPYLVFFFERQDDLWVVAVAHASRKPGYWNERL